MTAPYTPEELKEVRAELTPLRNGLTEVIDCSCGSNPEEIMAGIARRTLERTRDLRG